MMGQRGNRTWLAPGIVKQHNKRTSPGAKTIRADAESRDNKKSDQPSLERGTDGTETNGSVAEGTREREGREVMVVEVKRVREVR